MSSLKAGILGRYPHYTPVQRHNAEVSLSVSILVWLVGLGAIVFLFSKESAAFAQQSAPR